MNSFLVERRLIPGYPDALVRSRVLATKGSFMVVWRPDIRVSERNRYALLVTHGDPAVFSLVATGASEDALRREMVRRA